jgi:hypothetical protein
MVPLPKPLDDGFLNRAEGLGLKAMAYLKAAIFSFSGEN